ncbi:unnamed protein product [Penicillium salamii]|uniref:Acyltransferase 3 domain-containing protein n=1 Tax=Penicillium salamii TaxID=1612424 RepID=A0A9W4IPD6_9EURO|nr:unnamed protein product [Penicillium salamii]CAG8295968.1 unnamed protein product [Penicillium salamii]CAG8346996.1 unnamed protein product [Penicillium salamii]CAG8348980.1 unnamed protein product [Penicillium salamii]CAG8353508.1 unnamed protein product [Penicillium salamii]
MPRVKWINGLRGAAAAVVAFNHYFNGEITTPFRTYWTEPLKDNQQLIQLPPINFLWSMDAMVPLFYVISGYSTASGLLELRDKQSELFIDRVRSSAIRRFIRLVLPLIGLGVFCQITFFCGLFIRSLPEDSAPGLEPWSSPWSHLGYLTRYVADSLQLFQIQYNHGLSQQFWTIPLDLRGSFVVYLVIILQAPWRPRVRLSLLALLLAHTLWYGIWDMFSILSGLALAEISALYNRTGYQPRFLRGTISYVIRFAIAAYLGSLSSKTSYPPDFRVLELAQPWRWSRYDWTNARQNWHSIAVVCLFSILMQSPRLQGILTMRPFQYLGRLSFAIYLVHVPIYQIIRAPLRDYLWRLQENREWPGPWEASQSLSSFYSCWVASGIVSYLTVFIAAWSYMQYVSPHVDRISRDTDKWLNQTETEALAEGKKGF